MNTCGSLSTAASAGRGERLVSWGGPAALNLAPLRTVTAALPTGDYSLRGLEHVVAIERKSLADLITCIGQERQRFDREVRRLLAYPVRALVIEAEWSDLDRGDWRGQVTPAAAVGSCLGWIAAGLPVLSQRRATSTATWAG